MERTTQNRLRGISAVLREADSRIASGLPDFCLYGKKRQPSLRLVRLMAQFLFHVKSAVWTVEGGSKGVGWRGLDAFNF